MLKKKLIITTGNQVYGILLGFLVVPIYLHYLGVEAYGLVGLFAMTLAWLAVLDAGIGAGIIRESARFKSGAVESGDYSAVIRLLARFFLATSIILVLIGVPLSPWIATGWLNVERLEHSSVVVALISIIVSVAARWQSEPFRNVLVGHEEQIWLSCFNAVALSLKYLGGALMVWLRPGDIEAFFYYQGVVALFEALVIRIKGGRYVPAPAALRKPIRELLAPLLGFMLGAAFANVAWIAMTQVDKVSLSKFISLESFGVFSTTTIAASAVMMLNLPFYQIVLPRLTALKAAGDEQGFFDFFRLATQITVAVITAVASCMALFSYHLLWLWTGNAEVAAMGASVLALYVVGNALQVIYTFCYSLQYACGNLTFNTRAFACFLPVFVPVIVWAAYHYGAVGTGAAWVGINLFLLFVWSRVVFARFVDAAFYRRWMVADVLPLMLLGLLVPLGFYWALPEAVWAGRLSTLLTLLVLGVCALSAALSALYLRVNLAALLARRPRWG